MTIHSLLEQNINHVVLSGEGNENGKKSKDQYTLYFISEYCFFGQEGA